MIGISLYPIKTNANILLHANIIVRDETTLIYVFETVVCEYLIFQSHVLPLRSGRSSASGYFSGAEDDAIQGWVGKNFSKGDVGRIMLSFPNSLVNNCSQAWSPLSSLRIEWKSCTWRVKPNNFSLQRLVAFFNVITGFLLQSFCISYSNSELWTIYHFWPHFRFTNWILAIQTWSFSLLFWTGL